MEAAEKPKNGEVKVSCAANGFANKTVIFETVDSRTEMKLLIDLTSKNGGEGSEKSLAGLKDLQKYIVTKEESSWLLDDRLHQVVDDILKTGIEEAKTRLVRLLAVCSLKDDFINFLNLDKIKNRSIMNYANGFDDLSLNEQKATGMFLCNLFARPQTASYALYHSNWNSAASGEKTSNAQILVNVATACLNSRNPSLQQYGSGIFYNIGLRETVKVLEKPNTDKSNWRFGDTSLDVEDKSLSDLKNGGNFVALKAFDEMVVDICSCLFEVITSKKDLQDDVLFRCLQTLVNFIHMLDMADSSEMTDSLRALQSQEPKLSERNLKLIDELITKST